MEHVTPYGKASELALQNERLIQTIGRERQALSAERNRIADAVEILDEDARWQDEEHILARVRKALTE